MHLLPLCRFYHSALPLQSRDQSRARPKMPACLGGFPLPKMTGSRFLAETLHGYGVSHVFFVPAVVLQAMAEMEDFGIRRVMTHGEKAAAYMADGFARAARKPGICLAQNIGASNLAAGLRDAILGGKPSPITYNSPKPQAIMDEDKEIEKLPIPIEKPDWVTVTPVEKVFE